jgi:hypothetical protein
MVLSTYNGSVGFPSDRAYVLITHDSYGPAFRTLHYNEIGVPSLFLYSSRLGENNEKAQPLL